jgi:hypothetical protein
MPAADPGQTKACGVPQDAGESLSGCGGFLNNPMVMHRLAVLISAMGIVLRVRRAGPYVTKRTYGRLAKDGQTTPSYPREMEASFGRSNVVHGVANCRKDQTADWITKAIMNGRYELNLRVPVNVDLVKGKISGENGPVQIRLNRVRE